MHGTSKIIDTFETYQSAEAIYVDCLSGCVSDSGPNDFRFYWSGQLSRDRRLATRWPVERLGFR